jgi:hypothetical protein
MQDSTHPEKHETTPPQETHEDIAKAMSELIAELRKLREVVADLTNAIDMSAGWIEEVKR